MQEVLLILDLHPTMYLLIHFDVYDTTQMY